MGSEVIPYEPTTPDMTHGQLQARIAQLRANTVVLADLKHLRSEHGAEAAGQRLRATRALMGLSVADRTHVVREATSDTRGALPASAKAAIDQKWPTLTDDEQHAYFTKGNQPAQAYMREQFALKGSPWET